MGVTPHTLAEAWAIECKERGADPHAPGSEDAENLFYAGAAAMFAMVAATNPRNIDTLFNFMQTTKAELEQYLERLDA